METKMPVAQCGQFVLFPNEANRSFDYSSRSKYPINADSQAIMDHMKSSFDAYKNAGSKGLRISMNTAVFYSWIKNYYKSKGVEFFVTKKNSDFIIFPIERFEHYYDVSAMYRMKKSGSTSPNRSNYDEIKKVVGEPTATITSYDSKVYIKTRRDLTDVELEGYAYSYIFRFKSENNYLVRRLSRTYNSNVIFSVSLKRGQDESDIAEFRRAVYY